MRKFLNNNFGFSGLETLRSQNTGKEVTLVNLIKALEKKGQVSEIIDKIKIHCSDDAQKVKLYLMNVMESTMETSR